MTLISMIPVVISLIPAKSCPSTKPMYRNKCESNMAAPLGHSDSSVAGQKHLIDELESSFHVTEVLYLFFHLRGVLLLLILDSERWS